MSCSHTIRCFDLCGKNCGHLMYFHFVRQRRLDHWHGNTHVACQQWDFDAHVCWDMEVSKVMEVPPNHPFIDRIFPYKPSILGATPSHMEPPACLIWASGEAEGRMFAAPVGPQQGPASPESARRQPDPWSGKLKRHHWGATLG